MKKNTKSRFALGITLALTASAASAVPFTPTFSDYAFPGSQYNVDAAANTFFSDNYGISITNAYLYRDARDAFDGIGIANGNTPLSGTQTGRIDFIDTTDFLSVDYLSIQSTTFSAYAGDGTLISTFTTGNAESNGTHLFSGLISYLTWTSSAGYGAISGLSYDYDGVTDGRNDDLPPTTSVPESGSWGLLALGLALVGFSRRKKQAA